MTSGSESDLFLYRNPCLGARLIRLRVEWEGPQPYISIYSDNYIDLLPGEKKSISLALTFPGDMTTQVRGRSVVGGNNLAAIEIPIAVNP